MTFCRRLVLTLTVLGFAYTAFAQSLSSETYYRHFYVQVKNLSQDEFQTLQNSAKTIDHINVVDYCERNPGALIRVNANYPKRVYDITTELETLISNHIPKRRILEVNMVTNQDKTTYCK